MMNSQWPKTLEEAVNVCLLTMTPKEKEIIKNTPEEKLINFHFNWAMSMRNKFGMSEGNDEIISSCGAWEPDGASNIIVKAVWKELNRQPKNTI